MKERSHDLQVQINTMKAYLSYLTIYMATDLDTDIPNYNRVKYHSCK